MLRRLLRPLDLRPGVPQRHRPVEHRRVWPAVRVDAEVAEPFELDLVARLGFGQTRLQPAVVQDLQRAGVQVILDLTGGAGRVRVVEQPVVEADLGLDRVRR